MIYTIAEWIATFLESLIIFIFLISTLSFKEQSNKRKYSLTISSFIAFNALIFMINYLYTLEGILTISYILVLILYCRLALQRKLWFQSMLVVIVLLSIYIINITTTLIVSNILQLSSEQVLSMRNPLRIFLLVFTKILFIIVLYIIRNLFTTRKMIFSTTQCIIFFLSLCFSLCASITFEKIQLENNVSGFESNLVTICLILINCLFLVVTYLISSQNTERIKNEILRVQIESDKKNVEEAVVWNKKIETIQHDMKNHLYCISDLIENNEKERAINYLEKIIDKSVKAIPSQILTNHSSFNAVLNLKKNQCDEKQIDFKCFVPETLPDFDDMDLCIVISNLLDNAIEAEIKEEYAAIDLSISIIGNYLNIRLKNRISRSVLKNNQKLQTTKSDKEHHGLGILSVMDVVQQNDGMHEFYEDDNWFVANVMLKLNASLK